MEDLTQKKCVACEGIGSAFNEREAQALMGQVADWQLHIEEAPFKISREFTFNNFKQALEFVNGVGEIAESEGHHPNILLHDYKKATITLYTHALKGLTENDYIVAAKINAMRDNA